MNEEIASSDFDFKYLGEALNEHAIVSATDSAGNIVFANQKFLDISGYSLSELLGKNHRLLKSGIHSPSFYRRMWETIVSGVTWQGEVCNRTKSGSMYWVSATIKPILDENGLPQYYVSIRTLINIEKQSKISTNDDANIPLSILLVEDDRMQVVLIKSLLSKFGHKIHIAVSGEEAVDMFRQIKPDLVLMDVTLPGMDGYEVTKAIRSEHAEWVPIIFLSGLFETTDRLRALEVGGDDFFTKPVDRDELIAKMKVMSRIHSMQKKLSQYMVEHEEDDELAAYVMDQYLSASQNDLRVEFSILSATYHFSGDAISVAKTSDGGLNVMMLDAMGHGLPAAINVLPAIQAFYSMSKKGLAFDVLIPEINDIVCKLSPRGHFLAGTFIQLDSTSSNLKGWIGGTPKVLINCEGEIHSFKSNNFSLGVLPSSDLNFEYFNSPWSEKSMLVTCTDGVLESQGKDGNDLGNNWLESVIQQYGNSLNRSLFDKLWKESLGENTPHDDASVLIIRQSPAQPN